MSADAQMYESRQRVIAATEDRTLRDDRAFFLDLDRVSVRGIAASGADPASELGRLAHGGLERVVRELLARVRARAACTRPARATDELVEPIRLLSAMQMSATRRFGDVREPHVAERVSRAFERFAGGHLRYEVSGAWFGEPDSAFFFLWPEFAWTARELDIDAPEWTALLPGLVRSQLVYVYVYGPRPLARAAFEDFHRGFHADVSSPRLREFVRHQFFGLDIEEVERAADRQAWSCFSDGTPWRATPG